MPRIRFTPHLRRHVAVEDMWVEATTVSEALEAVFALRPSARSYLLDDNGAVRFHVAIFLDGQSITDRKAQADPVDPDSQIDVLQALSGG
jgi:molybdopterin synthase sulfur carrier subunit